MIVTIKIILILLFNLISVHTKLRDKYFEKRRLSGDKH